MIASSPQRESANLGPLLLAEWTTTSGSPSVTHPVPAISSMLAVGTPGVPWSRRYPCCGKSRVARRFGGRRRGAVLAECSFVDKVRASAERLSGTSGSQGRVSSEAADKTFGTAELRLELGGSGSGARDLVFTRRLRLSDLLLPTLRHCRPGRGHGRSHSIWVAATLSCVFAPRVSKNTRPY